MKNLNFRAALPHLIALAVFLIVTLILCRPGLDSDLVLKQQDISGWKGMSHQAAEYKEIHGHYPLWLSNMFSGMPAYQVIMEGSWSPVSKIDHLIQLGLPQPMNFFFLACICFYFMCLCFGVRPFIAILGAIGFAYSSFSPIMITAGHNSQMLALSYAPAVIGSIVLIFNRRYLAGFALATLFTSLQISQGHQQISYYLFLILLAMSVNYIIRLFKEKQTQHLVKSLGLMVIAGIIAIAVNALILWTVYDYTKDSKRGGQLVMQSDKGSSSTVKTKGLSKDYAFQWSYGKMETLSLIFPGVMGYGTHYAERDGEPYMFPHVGENSHVVTYMTDSLNVPPNAVEQISSYMSQQLYWGDQPFTNGPVYLGAVFCFLFIVALFVLDNKHKWWILATCLLAVLLSWGKNLPGFNYFIFDHIPFYNKFRAPTMTLVIPQLLVPLLAALGVQKIADNNDPENWKLFRRGLFASATVFLVALVIYVNSDFSQENKERTRKFDQAYQDNDPANESRINQLNSQVSPLKDNRLYEDMVMNFRGNPEAKKMARQVVSEVRQDRAGLFGGDIIRSFIFILIAAVFLGAFIKKLIPLQVMIAGVILTAAIDLLSFDSKYLNDKSFDSKDKYESSEFPLSPADDQIKKDTDPDFRVFNLSGGDPFQESRTSYYHKSIGGYHPAKIGIYDDLATHQLSGNPNIEVLNMLNTKYVIQKQGNDLVASRNPGSLGNAWFVKGVRFVNGPSEEMTALNHFNPKDTAVVDESYKKYLEGIAPADSSASVKLSSFDNDAISYQSVSGSTSLAVFSEIFYKDWKATIDGNPSEVIKCNYVLRGLVIPAGNHKIEFNFHPVSYYSGRLISNIANWLVVLILLGFILLEFMKRKKE